MKFTVKELIETLKQCPQDYEIQLLNDINATCNGIESIGIDNENKTVDFFLEF